MACGIPVVGSDSGEIPQVIGEAGLIFPEDDEEALRALLDLLMEDEDMQNSLAKKGRERVAHRYTQERIARATHDVYVNMMLRPS